MAFGFEEVGKAGTLEGVGLDCGGRGGHRKGMEGRSSAGQDPSGALKGRTSCSSGHPTREAKMCGIMGSMRFTRRSFEPWVDFAFRRTAESTNRTLHRQDCLAFRTDRSRMMAACL